MARCQYWETPGPSVGYTFHMANFLAGFALACLSGSDARGSAAPSADSAAVAPDCEEVAFDECSLLSTATVAARELDEWQLEEGEPLDSIAILGTTAALEDWLAGNHVPASADDYAVAFEREQVVGTTGSRGWASLDGSWVSSFGWDQAETSLIAIVTVAESCHPVDDSAMTVAIWATPIAPVGGCRRGTQRVTSG